MPRPIVPRALARHGPDALAAVRAAADRIGIPMETLATVIYMESGWNPRARNAQSGAVGLAQWMPATARAMGVDPAAIPGMTIPEQLALLVRYARRAAPKATYDRPVDAWLLLFMPRWIGAEYPKVLAAKGSTAYAQNAALDADKDGTITVQDLADTLEKRASKIKMVEVDVPDYDPLAPLLAGRGVAGDGPSPWALAPWLLVAALAYGMSRRG